MLKRVFMWGGRGGGGDETPRINIKIQQNRHQRGTALE